MLLYTMAAVGIRRLIDGQIDESITGKSFVIVKQTARIILSYSTKCKIHRYA